MHQPGANIGATVTETIVLHYVTRMPNDNTPPSAPLFLSSIGQLREGLFGGNTTFPPLLDLQTRLILMRKLWSAL